MPEDKVKKLLERGLLTELPDGRKGVSITIQDQRRFASSSRDQRRVTLEQEFKAIAEETVEPEGGKVAIETVSVSGQSVEAVIPAERFEEIKKQIESKGVRVDILQYRQILE